jgi:hypothetical protein
VQTAIATPSPTPPAETTPVDTEASKGLGTGFRLAFAVWAMGFLFLLLFEIGGFLLKLLRQLF